MKRKFKILKPVTHQKGFYGIGRVAVFDDDSPQIKKYLSLNKIIPLEDFIEDAPPDTKAVVELIAPPEEVKKEAVVSRIESPEFREDADKFALISDMGGTEVRETLSKKKKKSRSSPKKKKVDTDKAEEPEKEEIREEPITEEEAVLPEENPGVQETDND